MSREPLKWTIVAFNHPEHGKSVLYRQNVSETSLMNAIKTAIDKGANLMSIRGLKND